MTLKRKIIVCIPGFHPIRTWLLKRSLKKSFGNASPDKIHNMFREYIKMEGFTLTMEDGVEVYRDGKSTIRIENSPKDTNERKP